MSNIKVIEGRKSRIIERVKKNLIKAFKMVDIDPISFYLGLIVEKNRAKKMLKLLQPVYITKILAKYHLN